MRPAMTKVTPKAVAALELEAETLAEVPVAVPVALAVAEDVVEAALTPDFVTAKTCDWVTIPEFRSVFPMKLIW